MKVTQLVIFPKVMVLNKFNDNILTQKYIAMPENCIDSEDEIYS